MVYSSPRTRPIFPVMTKDELRSERRVRSRGNVTLLAEGNGPVHAKIYDVSEIGLGLEIPASLNPGTAVGIHGAGFAGHGVVRFCYHIGGGFRVGIELMPLKAA